MATKPKKAKKNAPVARTPAPAPKAAAAPAAAAASTPPQAKVATPMLDALLKATGEAPPKPGETLPEFAFRIFVKVPDLSDDVFNALPQEVKDWYDRNTDLYNSKQLEKMDGLPGMPGTAGAAPAEAGTTTAAAAAPKPSAVPPVAASAAAAAPSTTTPNQEQAMAKTKKGGKKGAGKKADDKTSEPKERAPRTDGVAYKIREAVVKKPTVSFEDACAAAGVKGAAAKAGSGSHAFNYYNHARVVLQMFMAHRKIEK